MWDKLLRLPCTPGAAVQTEADSRENTGVILLYLTTTYKGNNIALRELRRVRGPYFANMAEPLGGVASVLTVVESLAYATKTIRACKNTPKESQRLVRELSYVRGLLTTLQETVEEQEASNPIWSKTVLLLQDPNGLLHQFQELLDQLNSRIAGPSTTKGFQKFKNTLKWPFKEPETLEIIDMVE